MSPDIWTQCAGKFNLQPLNRLLWRVVESQSQTSTRKLVDSAEEQVRLESLIDKVKPGAPTSQVHYLLFTPFRYSPFRQGSRFRTAFEPGLWYGSESAETAFAEVAFWRLCFLEDTEAALAFDVQLTAFQARLHTAKSLDLTHPPFDDFSAQISDKTTYAYSQPLGTAMRAADVEAFRYVSARDPQGGCNMGVFSPKQLTIKTSFEEWHCYGTRGGMEFKRQSFLKNERFLFPRALFEVAGRLPRPT